MLQKSIITMPESYYQIEKQQNLKKIYLKIFQKYNAFDYELRCFVIALLGDKNYWRKKGDNGRIVESADVCCFYWKFK